MDIIRKPKNSSKITIKAPRISSVLKHDISWRAVHLRYFIANKTKAQPKTFEDLFKGSKTDSELLSYHTPVFPPLPPETTSWFGFVGKVWSGYSLKRKMVMVSVLACIFSFGAGAISVVHEDTIKAEVNTQQPIEYIEPLDFTEFLNTSLKNLESYNQKPAGPDQLVLKRASLKSYLEEMNSPFAQDEVAIDIFLAMPHMKLILAISFAESTMGQNCYFNNCSGIGGTPPNLRKYDEFKNWIIDLNDLLERRYKDWTIEEMCGVYVQPCNTQWPRAVSRVLTDLNKIGF